MSKSFRNKTWLLCLVALLQCLGAAAQSRTSELSRVAKYYRSLSAFSLKVTADFYATENTTAPGRSMSGWVETQGNLSRTVFDNRETLLGTDFVLVADHANRSVYYSPRTKETKKAVSVGTEMLDSTFMVAYTITEKKLDDTHSRYLFVPKKLANSEFRSITIRVDHSRHILQEIVYLYSGDVKFKKVVIRYTSFNTAWQAEKGHFSEMKYIAGRQKNARLQPAYSSYRLINSFNYDPKKDLLVDP